MTLTDLTIGYEHKVVQSHLTFTLEQGQLISLLGPNGSGKSTLLRTIAGLQPSLGGQILVNGIDISPMSPAERAKQQALVLTDNQPLEATTVFDIVA
ncbi:MAG: ABC transporter ATP-binding protein, partial [Bacteroidales bacterium]|nr:ABC transporter ATP-binding protein [Bacteroidales bacterium]